ncbi:MAG: hypothetical protein R3B45_17910 [Bdellovibrionota bacterium]
MFLAKMIKEKKKELYCSFIMLMFINSLANGQILLPKTPTPVAPPGYGSSIDNTLKTKRKYRMQRNQEIRSLEKPTQSEDSKQLLSETLAERPLRLAIETNLIYPRIKTTKNRDNYTTDITSHLKVFLRNNKDLRSNVSQFWYGARIAMFSGTGEQNNKPGRYGFTYFGPMVGVGKISLGTHSLGNEKMAISSQQRMQLPVRSGWFWMMGVSAQSILSSRESTEDEPEDDFNSSKKISFDPPGLWLEYTYFQIHYGALGLHYSVGAQQGKGKLFVYLGLGIAGWN